MRLHQHGKKGKDGTVPLLALVEVPMADEQNPPLQNQSALRDLNDHTKKVPALGPLTKTLRETLVKNSKDHHLLLEHRKGQEGLDPEHQRSLEKSPDHHPDHHTDHTRSRKKANTDETLTFLMNPLPGNAFFFFVPELSLVKTKKRQSKRSIHAIFCECTSCSSVTTVHL